MNTKQVHSRSVSNEGIDNQLDRAVHVAFETNKWIIAFYLFYI